jgi:hypothetical protein
MSYDGYGYGQKPEIDYAKLAIAMADEEERRAKAKKDAEKRTEKRKGLEAIAAVLEKGGPGVGRDLLDYLGPTECSDIAAAIRAYILNDGPECIWTGHDYIGRES